MAVKLKRREKYAVAAAAGFVCLFAVLQWIVFPQYDERSRLQRTAAGQTQTLAAMVELQHEISVLGRQRQSVDRQLAHREKGFTLFSFLDRLAGETGLKDHITYMKPSSSPMKDSDKILSRVEMKLHAIGLDQLTTYLYRIETSKNRLHVKRFSLAKTAKPEGFVDAVMEVETLETPSG